VVFDKLTSGVVHPFHHAQRSRQNVKRKNPHAAQKSAVQVEKFPHKDTHGLRYEPSWHEYPNEKYVTDKYNKGAYSHKKMHKGFLLA